MSGIGLWWELIVVNDESEVKDQWFKPGAQNPSLVYSVNFGENQWVFKRLNCLRTSVVVDLSSGPCVLSLITALLRRETSEFVRLLHSVRSKDFAMFSSDFSPQAGYLDKTE